MESTKVAATAGLVYTGSGYFTRVGSRTAATSVHFYDASNAELSAPTITLTNVANANVPERRSSTRTAPAGTTQVALRMTANGAIAMDGMLLEQSSTLGAYFDGSTTQTGYTYAWTGTAHASSSTETLVTLNSALSGSGTLTSVLIRIQASLSGSGTLTSAPSKVRTNLSTNPSIETNTTGFTDYSVTSTQSTDHAYSGTKSLKVTYNGTTTQYNGGVNHALAVTAGVTYKFSVYVWVPTGQQPAVLQVQKTSETTITGTATTVYDAWERLTVTFTAGSGGTGNFFIVNNSTSAAGKYFYADAWLVETASTFDTYFDGASLQTGYTYSWNGASNASTSTEMARRTNLITNPSCETNTTGWSNVNGSTLSSSADHAWVGTKSQKVVYDSTARGVEQTGTSIASYPMTNGVTYTFSAYVWVPTGQPAVKIKFGGAFLNVSGTVSTTNDQWERLSVTAAATSTNAVYLYILNNATSVPNATGFYVDGALLEKATTATVGSYFDGSTTQSGYAYAWTGASNATTSIATPVAGSGIASALSGSGTLSSALARNIASALSGAGSLTTGFTNYVEIASALSGSGTLTASLHRYIDSQMSGSGTLTSVLGLLVHSDFSGSGTMTSALHRYILSDLSGSGSLGSVLSGYAQIDSQLSGSGALTSHLSGAISSAFSGSGTLTSMLFADNIIYASLSGSGWLQSHLTYSPRFDSHFSGQGILYSELGYVVLPPELGTGPLQKLVSFSVSTSAVPLNPAEGSGAAPSVSIGYIKGVDPEFALGETNVLTWGTVGTYEGEIVRLSLPEGSDVAAVSQDTALTLLNTELHLFPFIDAAPSTWTAARAIDYWTQQCGLFYDKVPGDCIAYASGYGHTDTYGAGTTSRFYEKLVGGTTSTTVLNNRSVKTLGSAVTGTTAFHELPKGNVAVSVPKNHKLVASIGLGIRGTGRTTTVSWNMLDAQDGSHNVSISATSAGLITASVAGVPVDSTTVAPNGDYRITFSVERVSTTGVIGKLTVHTDDLDGTGALAYTGLSQGITYALPAVLRLTDITHVSAGGSGAEILRWGTYLSVTQGHPMELPAVQKTLSETVKEFGFVSGFEGNVWSLLNEYCAITRQDISFLESRMRVTSRITGLSVPVGNFSRFSYDSERREKYKQVAVMNKQSKAVALDDAILWRADSVFQVAAREVFQTTVQTGHSILNVLNPVAVDGIWPFPYKTGAGQYVVTGADGYIIAPAWWNDNGGKVEVSLTGKEGEIAVKITAPIIDTVRAPYRISEGAADRPALYVAGSGILNDPKEVHVGTGAKNAKEGFDNVFESPFIAGPMETYDTAAAMAAVYSASVADVSFELPNDFYTPTRFGQFPSGTRFTDGKRNYRITSASQTHSKVSGNAVPNTTIRDYVASYPAGSTIADETARHAGRSIKQFNIKPLRGNQ